VPAGGGRDRVRCGSRLHIPLPAGEAIELFTPEGERRWAAGWDPRYPAPEHTRGEGAVFVTAGHGHTYWIMVDAAADRVRYARVAPGVSAGTVTVSCVEAEAGASTFEVSYDLTALGEDGRTRIAELERGYAAEIAEWERAIARALGT
jgi:hypothetical protein